MVRLHRLFVEEISMSREEVDNGTYLVKCWYCDGSGEYEPDNNGPIEDCPVCNGDGHYLVAEVSHYE